MRDSPICSRRSPGCASGFANSRSSEVRNRPEPSLTRQRQQEGGMPWGSWVNDLPTGFFLAVHLAAFAIGASFAWTAFKRDLSLLGVGFTLFALAEISY